MAEYNFEGNISGIDEHQLKFINDKLVEHELKNDQTKVKFEPVGKVGDNYVANVMRLTIEGEESIKTLIAKIAPTNEMVRMTMNTLIMFRNEHYMYMEVLPKFSELENEADVPDEQRLKYAKCYGSFTEQPYEVILLEDLKESNFTMLDRFESLSDDCIKSVLRNFAILHSLSFALKKAEPQTFDRLKLNLIDIWTLINGNEETDAYFQQLENDVLSTLDNVEHKNILRHKIIDIPNIAAKLSKVEVGSKHSVILQGDSWTNNIMFRIQDNSKVDSIMIDYQISKEGNPASDLLYLILNCTDHKMRSKHFLGWIDYYHTELDKSLSNFGLKANFVYPKDKLDADLKRYGKLLFGQSVILATILIRKSEDAISFTEELQKADADMALITNHMQVSTLNDDTQQIFKERILGLVTTVTEFGIL